MFLFAKQVEELLEDSAQMSAMFASLQVDSEVEGGDLPVVCEFKDVFPYDISDFPLENKVGFSIDLVSGASSMLMAPYRMLASELGELNK